MRALFRIFIVSACLLVVLAMVLPIIFGDKRPPVYRAAVAGDTNYIRDYLARGSNVNALVTAYHAGHQYAPLLLGAVGGGQADAVDFLLKNGANPNQADSSGHTPLIVAIGLDHTAAKVRIVEMLLSAGADPNLRESSPYGWTPLISAAELGRPEVARMLVAAGADVNRTDSGGATPLHYADNAEIARLLLAAGANRGATCTWVRGYPPVTNQATPADRALEKRRFDVLAVLTNAPAEKKD